MTNRIIWIRNIQYCEYFLVYIVFFDKKLYSLRISLAYDIWKHFYAKEEQTMTHTIIRIITGRTGRRLPEYGGLENIWTRGVMASYYRHSGATACDKHVRRILGGGSGLSHLIPEHYIDSYDRILADMQGIARTCTSLHRLRKIQAEIRDALPATVRAAAEPYYCPDATRDQIAAYLAQVMWHTYHG